MQQLEAHNLIESSPLFRHMQPHEADAILARLQPSHYQPGARILERGHWHGRLYIIASGQVSVLLQEGEDAVPASASPPSEQIHSHQSHPQSAYIVARLGPGECFGEMSLITGEPPTATIRVEQDTTLWSLAQTDFLALIGTCPTLLQNINGILSQRLARANQHLISQHSAEICWLALEVPETSAPIEQAIAFHIADALATRTRKRVLLLALCGQDEATCSHFATHTGQQRPSLLACIHDRSQLQAHHTPALSAHGEPIAAVAALADTQEQALALDVSQLLALSDLAALYDYILLITGNRTSTHLVEALNTNQSAAQPYTINQTLFLISARSQDMLAPHAGDPIAHETRVGGPFVGLGGATALAQSTSPSHSIFMLHTPEQPTIGLQDRYEQQLGRPITRLLPEDDDLLVRCWREQASLRQLAPAAPLGKAVDFVARFIARQTVGIAFGGGGARGFAHLGVLDGLLAHGIPLDYIAACSSGIIAPGMHLLGKSLAESEEAFMEIQRHIAQWNIPRTSIFSNRGLKRMLQHLCGEQRFEDLTTPFAMVAADLTTRAGVVLDRGLLWHAGLASVALPGIFPPVIIGKHILIDAGMHDPVPIRLVRRMGAHILLASELGGQEPPTLSSATPWLAEAALSANDHPRTPAPHMIDLLLRTYDLAMATIGMHSIREADVVIRPTLHRISLRQFSEGRKFVQTGREAVEHMLPSLRERLPWL
ncbi:MAG TPA: cyclic nucleotide-binding and patatin-like phospholipase domain-containing protein [Ktedonosporobacter sp.]|nr:cyclic nucleotide-binding and patatin-like phospholipase domain-containing protein [Ktedonosporobacter sp.]